MSALIFTLFILAALVRMHRGTTSRRIVAAYAARHPTGADGIVVGAESFALHAGASRALLLLHGSGDTPQTLRYLGERLQAAGYSVYAPLLPGHGRSPADFADVRADQYLEAARAGLDQLRREASWIGVVGLSMGGALAAQLAAEASDVRVLVLLAPYLEPPPLVRWTARTAPLWDIAVPYVAGRGEGSVHDTRAGLESHAYGVFSASAMRALVTTAAAGQRALARVEVPSLVVHSREDNRIPVAIAERASQALRGPVERHWLTGCGHVMTVDYCKSEVADLVLSFLSRHAPR